MSSRKDKKHTEGLQSEAPEPESAPSEYAAPDLAETMQPEEPGQQLAKLQTSAKPPHRFKAFLRTKAGAVLAIGVLILIVLAVVFSIPVTRYSVLGVAIKKDMTVVIDDSKTGKPVTQASVMLAGKTATSDSAGKARFSNVPVGDYTLKVSKKYYASASQAATVPIFGNPIQQSVSFKATGRQVPVVILNRISSKPVAKALISASDTSVTTDAKGEATIVLPANKAAVDATVKLDGYNSQPITITVTEQQDSKNSFTLIPSGTIYFLSKRTGTIDVVKSNLDGSNRQVVLKGTGKEDDGDTVLLASRDWKYMVLKAVRDSDQAKLYLIDTTNSDKLNTIDEGNATFTLVGWQDHRFVYQVRRNGVNNWQPKREAIKSFNAENGALATIAETAANGTNNYDFAYETLKSSYLVGSQVIFTKDWGFGSLGNIGGTHSTINSVGSDGSNPQVLKQFDVGSSYLTAEQYSPKEVYFEYGTYNNNDTPSFWEYDSGKFNGATITTDDFRKGYPTYLLSPSGQKTFWYESRDGKDATFIGDEEGKNGQEIASLDGFTPYGWYGDNYILFSKNGSELYIAPAGTLSSEQNLLKITDYHKPVYNYYGYGGGYGGL